MIKTQGIKYKNTINKKIQSLVKKKLNQKYSQTFKNILKEINSNKNVLNTLNPQFKLNFSIKDLKKYKKFKKIVVLGMGGSILGAKAIYFFLRKKIKKNFIFIDNIDEEQLNLLKQKHDFKKILFLLISKSGNTIETLSILGVLRILKKKTKNIIVISERKKNLLYLASKKLKIFHIEHRSYVGGRYSVFSEVGLVPAYLMGLNTTAFKKDLIKNIYLKNKSYFKNNLIKLSQIYKERKIKTLVLLNYAPHLNDFLYWCQQLLAESLGKNSKGFLPIVSSAPKDHHSLLQLYLDGPRDKIFYVFSTDHDYRQKIKINFLNQSNFLNNKSLSSIKKAQKNAFLKILKKKKIPFNEFIIKKNGEKIIGELFTHFIFETIALGKLNNINPYNQPAVEQVKIETKKILI